MTARIIETLDDVAEGCDWLAARDPVLARAYGATGLPPLRRRSGGFPALMQVICGQQLSVASAAAVWGRLEEAGATEAADCARLDDSDLRAAGLSRPKIRYVRALIEADLDYDALAVLPEDEAVARLMAVKGLGRWSAEIYLKFSVGRADVFAAGDLALQEAARVLHDLPDRPSEKALRAMAAAWSPWRAVAARLLWAYYRVAKRREGISE